MNQTPLEDQVQDALHRRVDPIQHSPLTVTDVRQRARRIQRKRDSRFRIGSDVLCSPLAESTSPWRLRSSGT